MKFRPTHGPVWALTALALAAVPAHAATQVFDITVTIGDVSSDGLALGTGPTVTSNFLCSTGSTTGCFSGNFDSSGDRGWTSNGVNSLDITTPANRSYFYSQGGFNGTSYYNPYDQYGPGGVTQTQDYTAYGQPNCTVAGFVFDFSCSQKVGATTKIFPTPVFGVGPAAVATGQVTIDTVAGTLTGTLTTQAYVYRTGDGSPFNAAALYVSPQGKYTLNLTGTFTNTTWTITGGNAPFTDPGADGTTYGCFAGDLSNTLCNASAALGGHQSDSSELSWRTANVFDKPETAGGTLQFTVPGASATATVDGAGNVTGSGEFHRMLGAVAAGCTNTVAYDPVNKTVTCGQLLAGIISISGTKVGNPIPVAADDSAATNAGVPVTIDVLANDSSLTDTPVTVQVTVAPTHGAAVVNANNTVTYTPAGGYAGADSFKYTVTDATPDVSNAATVSITINDLPHAVDDTAAVAVLKAVTIPVLANDTGLADTPLAVVTVSNPAHGTVLVNADKTITYTADGTGGTFTFQYKVTDKDGENSTATVTVTVTDSIPVAVADSGSTAINTPVAISVLDNDTGLADTPIAVTIASLPSHGAVTVSAANVVTYTPEADFSGTDTFTYKVTDANASIATATVTVSVKPDKLPGGSSALDPLLLAALAGLGVARGRGRRRD